MSFPFENLDVYQKALRFFEVTDRMIGQLRKRLNPSIRDQLIRAALSIPLNIAEGNGRWHKKEKRQFFWIARGSVFETVSLIEIIRRKGLLNPDQYKWFRDELTSIGMMMTKLVQSTEK